MKQKLYRFFLLTVSTLVMAVGIYFFKFPNHFSFGGVTGLAVVVAKVVPYTASTISFAMNMILLIVGFAFLGRSFGIMTAYSSLLLSVGLTVLERICPMPVPLTDQPMLELCYAIALPAMASAVLFHIGASSGGTDILAMIFKKYSGGDIGVGLFISDLIVVLLSFFVFDIRTGLFSFVGLMVKSLVIDNVIESINLCKYFNIICDDPEPICRFIVHRLGRSATVCTAQGAFTHGKKYIVFTALKRPQAVALRKYVRTVEPTAFILVTNTSEIIGKGFQSYDL
ncbi:YitT family protein [Marasmitruncus massiliensis]|uniref:YitT family protein n=1 Tax=Marasmitruncus massiliensis TaxID=1944642 RepID=UPI000C7C58DB|nr:YitT family protein [Marasmitruncus massiliensis]MBE6906707.1 YitT family protein [Oscillospiraceae bacterium]